MKSLPEAPFGKWLNIYWFWGWFGWVLAKKKQGVHMALIYPVFVGGGVVFQTKDVPPKWCWYTALSLILVWVLWFAQKTTGDMPTRPGTLCKPPDAQQAPNHPRDYAGLSTPKLPNEPPIFPRLLKGHFGPLGCFPTKEAITNGSLIHKLGLHTMDRYMYITYGTPPGTYTYIYIVPRHETYINIYTYIYIYMRAVLNRVKSIV